MPLWRCFCECCWAGRQPHAPPQVPLCDSLFLASAFALLPELAIYSVVTHASTRRWVCSLAECCNCVDSVGRDFLVFFFLTSFVWTVLPQSPEEAPGAIEPGDLCIPKMILSPRKCSPLPLCLFRIGRCTCLGSPELAVCFF